MFNDEHASSPTPPWTMDRRGLLLGGGILGMSLLATACSVSSPTGASGSGATGSAGGGVGTPTKQFPLDRWLPDTPAGAKPPLPRRFAFLNTIAGGSAASDFDAAFRNAASVGNFEVIESNPQGDNAKGVQQSASMIDRGVVGFLNFNGVPEMLPVVKRAMAAGVGTISVNQGPATSSLYSIQYDGGYALGKYCAKYVKEKMGGKAQIAYLSMDFNATLALRGKGFKKALADEGASDLLVAYVTPPAQPGGTQQAGNALMRTVLQQHPGVNVVAGASDDLALGAVSAMSAAGKSAGDSMACGIDGGSQALKVVKEGTSIFKTTIGVNFNFAAYCPSRMMGRWAEGLTIPQVQIFNYFTIDSPQTAEQFIKDSSVEELPRVFDSLIAGDDRYVIPLGTISYATRNAYYDGDMVAQLPKLNFSVAKS